MEKARQYSPLTPAQWVYGGLLFGGTAVLLIGLVVQLIVGGKSIEIAALIFAPTRVGTSLMRAFYPRAIRGETSSRKIEVLWLVIWIGILFVVLRIAMT